MMSVSVVNSPADGDSSQQSLVVAIKQPVTIIKSSTTAGNNNELPVAIAGDKFDLFKPDDQDYSCGIWRWHPKYLQHFANKKCFLALFCLTSVLQGVYYTYFVSVLTTIEKLYQIPSRTTGIIMSSTEIGQISGALLVTYYGGQGHRPRWIATGMLVFAFAALLCSTPHYLFGSQPVQAFPEEAALSMSSLLAPPEPTLCPINASSVPGGFGGDSLPCNQESEVILQRSRVTHSVLGIFFMSLLMIGLGTTAVHTLGIPYIDDNVAPKESPLYFGITIGTRILGPVFGFLLGSLCTSIPVQFPFGTSYLTPTDPNWIGAWWLGLFLVGISLAVASIPMMIFPRRLPQPDPSSYSHQQQQYEQEKLIKQQQLDLDFQKCLETNNHHHHLHNHHHHNELKDKPTELVTFNAMSGTAPTDKKMAPGTKQHQSNAPPSMRGFQHALKRLLTNDILLCRTASSVLHILPISGMYTFLPKYLESQFQLTATDANMIAGLAGILVMGIGVFASSTFMRKFNPSARFVAVWIALAALSYVLGMVTLMFVGCPTNQFAGFKGHDPNGGGDHFVSADNEILTCSAKCQCPQGRFEPVCNLQDGITYLSPCLAGCTTVRGNSTKEKYYTNCWCSANQFNGSDSVNSDLPFPDPAAMVKPGICPLQCNILTFYIVIFSVTVLIHSTSEVGAMLLTLRCVEPRDKAMALGLLSFATGLFGNVPCPIIYGSIVDSTCLFWEEDCGGKRGACRLYDSTRFRQQFHGLTAFIMFLAFCIDLIVCYKASAIRINDDNDDAVEEPNSNNKNDVDNIDKVKP